MCRQTSVTVGAFGRRFRTEHMCTKTQPGMAPRGADEMAALQEREGSVPRVERPKYAYNPHLPPLLRFDSSGDADRAESLIAQAGQRALTDAEQSELREATTHHAPWLEWAGKREEQERGYFEADPVALHIHERVAAQAIVRTAMRGDVQRDLFADPEQPYQEAVQFYRYDVDWANRLILGDALQVMSSLARREARGGCSIARRSRRR